MYTKEEFKQRFRAMDTEELILNASRPLTDEAMEATAEILAERGLTGTAAREKTDDVMRAHLQGSGATRQCDYCGATTALGAIVTDSQKFCSERCRDHSKLAVLAVGLEPIQIAEHAKVIRRGPCPKCKRQGEIIEVRPVQRMVSVLVICLHERYEFFGCRRCYEKELRSSLLISGLMGWWSLKGLLRNPGILWRNVDAMGSRDPIEPSPALLKYASLDLARRSLAPGQTARI
ncbi:hypothetical protein [Lysobacter capsici]|uniref:hypothetical protein n=1 Tax=Lysobacter capsici TaxID=435897 RepID=UPI000BBB4E83|nr:hypothetical protein [Lysobacter capsici]ATE72395.1 hypothetical protein CNO08_14165 [Lysobacter capsici]